MLVLAAVGENLNKLLGRCVMANKIHNILKENIKLKEELQRLIAIVKENEAKHNGFTLVEDAFLISESLREVDNKALAYLEDIFAIDRVALFLDKNSYKFDPAETFVRIFFTSRDILKSAYLEKKPYFGQAIEGLISEFNIVDNIGSYLIAPIVENGQIIASLNLYSINPSRISGEAHADFIKELITRVWITLRTLNNMQILNVQNKYDSLTGIYDKNAMNDFLETYIEKYNSTGQGFSLLLIGIDNFDNFNDMHGHIAADTFLKTVAHNYKKLLDAQEIFGRFGGDIFYIILSVEKNVEAVFTKFQEIVCEAAAGFSPTTVSAGSVTIVNGMPGIDSVGVVRSACSAIRYSKLFGRRLTCSQKQDTLGGSSDSAIIT
jgi:diguanylate cyclase (GGDEF)-like protein